MALALAPIFSGTFGSTRIKLIFMIKEYKYS
jgi:hypothetical protein